MLPPPKVWPGTRKDKLDIAPKDDAGKLKVKRNVPRKTEKIFFFMICPR